MVETIYLFDKKWKTLKLSRESLPAKVATRNKSKKQNTEEGGVFENGAVAFSKRYFLKLVFLDIEVLKWFLLVQDRAVATSLSKKAREMYTKFKDNAYEKGKCFSLKNLSHIDFMCFSRFSTVLHSLDFRH